jgi:hypothetical protein
MRFVRRLRCLTQHRTRRRECVSDAVKNGQCQFGLMRPRPMPRTNTYAHRTDRVADDSLLPRKQLIFRLPLKLMLVRKRRKLTALASDHQRCAHINHCQQIWVPPIGRWIRIQSLHLLWKKYCFSVLRTGIGSLVNDTVGIHAILVAGKNTTIPIPATRRMTGLGLQNVWSTYEQSHAFRMPKIFDWMDQCYRAVGVGYKINQCCYLGLFPTRSFRRNGEQKSVRKKASSSDVADGRKSISIMMFLFSCRCILGE